MKRRQIINVAHRIGTKMLRAGQRWLGASTIGVRGLVINSKNEILLVHHTYMPEWHFPGGGVHAGETAKDAAIREVNEEAGVIVRGEVELFGVYYHQVFGVNDYPILYVIKEFDLVEVNSPEIEAIQWCHYDNLPPDSTQATKRRVQEYFYQHPIVSQW